MPVIENDEFGENNYVSGQVVLDKIKCNEDIDSKDSVDRLYRLKGAKGNIGIVTPLNNLFY